ncbi:MAG: uncharacterized protein A8A55_0276 [Amphiamblys sp. WSBS2006]|nr:MAG: uncharacterized protein A8A55_0276 [Amphiamblys sp. WSBS2006]
MKPETKTILKHKRMLFVFTDKNILVIPKRKYKRIRKSEKKHLQQDIKDTSTSEEIYASIYKTLKFFLYPASCSRERITCIVCKNRATSEDFGHSICKMMLFFLCKTCVKGLKERTNRDAIECPHCQSDETYRDEIVGAVLSLMPHQTLPSLEITPETKVETVTRLTRETKVVLSNVAVTDALFFKLMARTSVTIRNKISVVDHDNSLDRCIGELDWRAKERINICFDGYTDEEMKRVYENIATIPKNGTQINAGEIKATEEGIYVLLELRACIDRCIQSLSLESSKREYIEEILETESHLIWIAKVKKLSLSWYAVEILPKLRIHEENVMENLSLDADRPEDVAEILKTENNSIWIGKVKKLVLWNHAAEILPKLRIHEENVMEELWLYAYSSEYIAEIHKTENNSIWVGKVKKLELHEYAVEILPKLRIHEENVMEELGLKAYDSEDITGILEEENNSIWVGKVKRLELYCYTVGILPKLRFHEENVMEKLYLDGYSPGNITEIPKTENSSIWVGKVKKLKLEHHAVEILPKLGIHEENVMEELVLDAEKAEYITEILKTEANSIWVGRMKKIDLRYYAVGILPNLKFHEENVMEKFWLDADLPENITEMLKMENKSIWIGKVREINLARYAKEIKEKLDFTLMASDDQEENGGD